MTEEEILKLNNWKVLSDSTLDKMRKKDLIEYVRTLEHNYACRIETIDRQYSEGVKLIARLDDLHAQLEDKEEYIRKIDEMNRKMRCCTNCLYCTTTPHWKAPCKYCTDENKWEVKE